MKKILGAFAAGQSLQILILYVGIRLTYSTNTLAFCAIMGCVAMLMLCVGSGLTSIEMTTPADAEMEEAEPVSKHIKVTNDHVERVQEKPAKKRKSLGEQIAEAYDKFNAIDEAEKEQAKTVMETKLERVGADV